MNGDTLNHDLADAKGRPGRPAQTHPETADELAVLGRRIADIGDRLDPDGYPADRITKALDLLDDAISELAASSDLIDAAVEWLTDGRNPSTLDLLALEGLRHADWVDTDDERRGIVKRIITRYGTLDDMRRFVIEHDLDGVVWP